MLSVIDTTFEFFANKATLHNINIIEFEKSLNCKKVIPIWSWTSNHWGIRVLVLNSTLELITFVSWGIIKLTPVNASIDFFYLSDQNK